MRAVLCSGSRCWFIVIALHLRFKNTLRQFQKYEALRVSYFDQRQEITQSLISVILVHVSYFKAPVFLLICKESMVNQRIDAMSFQ